jgi:hypothetical protein
MQTRYGDLAIKMKDGRAVIDREPRAANHITEKKIFRSKWEEQFAYELVLKQRAQLIKGWAYEDMTFKLAHQKYHRPDFTIWHLDHSIEIAQVKGYHQNLRASLTALRWAAQQRPWFRFTLNRREGSCWITEEVPS